MTGGILNINKPVGMASFAVVSLVRRLTGVRKVGHAGTLDPIADGVLPICLGQATRIVEYLVSAPKSYRATIRFGAATDSYDREGTVIATGDASVLTEEDVASALAEFEGDIEQLPPMYSAIKYRGQPLYRYARAGKTAPREVRTVTIHRVQLTHFANPLAEVELEVGRGAYVRTLAHDLGEQLGCPAHLEGLTRLSSGPFLLEHAIGLEELEEAAREGAWQEQLHAADIVLESWYAALLGEQHTLEARQGRLLALTPARAELRSLDLDTLCRAYSHEGDFVAILRYLGGSRWQPERVFAAL